MTDTEHAIWCRVAGHSKKRRWYIPTASEDSVCASLFDQGYFQRRRSDGAYRLWGLWPGPYRMPSWIPPGDIGPHSYWPPYWPECVSRRRVPDLDEARAAGLVPTPIAASELLPS